MPGAQGEFSTEKKQTKDKLKSISQELKDQLKTYDKMDSIINKVLGVQNLQVSAMKSANEITNETTKDKLKGNKLDADALNMAKDLVDNVIVKADWPIYNNAKVDPSIFEFDISERYPVLNISMVGDFPVEELKNYAEYLEKRIENTRFRS